MKDSLIFTSRPRTKNPGRCPLCGEILTSTVLYSLNDIILCGLCYAKSRWATCYMRDALRTCHPIHISIDRGLTFWAPDLPVSDIAPCSVLDALNPPVDSKGHPITRLLTPLYPRP
jgi:hypothetical protein